MTERFFVEPPICSPTVKLIGDEFQHLVKVMRAQVGDEVTLFDGSGAEFTARVSSLGKLAAELEILARRPLDRELPFSLTLAVALPKGDRQKWLIEKIVELGVTCLIPLITERGVAQPVENALLRLRRGVMEASKQCGRNRLLEIGEPSDALNFFRERPSTATCWLADPTGAPLPRRETAATNILAAIGPEGGFTPAEVAAALAAGWSPISLGPRILRVETAAIAIAAWAGLGDVVDLPSLGFPVIQSCATPAAPK